MGLKIYTDGACSGNPGPGGYAIVICSEQDTVLKSNYYHEDNTTNNRMEMMAILKVLETYGHPNLEAPNVYSDSSYAINTFTDWMFGWERKGWLNSKNKTPENLDIVKRYFNLIQSGYRINLIKIKGHRGIEGNELADKLAKKGVENDKG